VSRTPATAGVVPRHVWLAISGTREAGIRICVRAGKARVVDEHINPRVPVHVTAYGGAITVRFAHPRAAPLGQPVPISPPDTDVFDAPELLAIDGEHAVAAFVAMSGERSQLLAVPLEVL
jgi:hypothetical protein